jgi:Fe-S-cluster containining protein
MMSAYEAGRFAAAAARAHIDVELYSLGGDGGFGVSVPLDTLRCPALGDDGRCRVYDARPIVCRLYGSVDELRCEHGCRPERLLSTSEARDVLRAAGEIEQ